MKILVTGAKGFVGRNLVENLKNIRDGKNRTRPQLRIEEIYEYDQENTLDDLDRFCAACLLYTSIQSSTDRVGFVIAQAENAGEAIKRCEMAESMISLRVL